MDDGMAEIEQRAATIRRHMLCYLRQGPFQGAPVAAVCYGEAYSDSIVGCFGYERTLRSEYDLNGCSAALKFIKSGTDGPSPIYKIREATTQNFVFIFISHRIKCRENVQLIRLAEITEARV